MANIAVMLGSYRRLDRYQGLTRLIGGVDEYSGCLERIGTLDIVRIRKLLNIDWPVGSVYIHDGIVAHVEFHHGGIYETNKSRIKNMIEYPDLIGKNPREPDSLELYIEESRLLLGIKRNMTGRYLFMATMYVLDNWEYKIYERLKSSRIRRFV